jgi:hypothetical protein
VKVQAISNAGDLRAKLREFEQVVKREASSAVRQFARLACVNLANATQPFSGKGASKRGKALGEKAVEVDVSKVFYTPEPQGGFVKAMTEAADESFRARAAKSKRGFKAEKARTRFLARLEGYVAGHNRKALRKLVKDFNWQGVVDQVDPALHQAARSGPRKKVNKRRKQLHLVLGGRRGAINTYTNKTKKRVGIAKSGWAACAQQISVDQKQKSTTGIPAWVTRHAGGREGSVSDLSRNARNPRVRMTNNIPWTSQVLSKSAERSALQMARDNFVKYMNRTIRAELRRRVQQ